MSTRLKVIGIDITDLYDLRSNNNLRKLRVSVERISFYDLIENIGGEKDL